MIFQRALRRELISTAGAVFTTLFTITITVMLIKILGRAAGGKVASQDVVALLGFAGLKFLPIILVLTAFISVLVVVTRSYQDSEMVVWSASGLSLTRWIAPIMSFGIPVVILTALLSFIVTPWASRQSAAFQERFEKREDVARVSPGKFQESSSSDRIFFAESVGDDSKVKNIFVNSVQKGRTSIVVAKDGTVAIDERGDKFLIMNQGRRYDGIASQADFRVIEFERYGVLVARQAKSLVADLSARALPTSALLANLNNFNSGELLWRISQPLMGLLLMLLAIPLGFTNPRAGRSGNLIVALLVFVVYSNLISVLQASVVQKRLPLALAWWPLHLFVALLIIVFFSWRLLINSQYHPAAKWGAFKRAWLFRNTGAK